MTATNQVGPISASESELNESKKTGKIVVLATMLVSEAN
jgi:hypothetical protein